MQKRPASCTPPEQPTASAPPPGRPSRWPSPATTAGPGSRWEPPTSAVSRPEAEVRCPVMEWARRVLRCPATSCSGQRSRLTWPGACTLPARSLLLGAERGWAGARCGQDMDRATGLPCLGRQRAACAMHAVACSAAPASSSVPRSPWLQCGTGSASANVTIPTPIAADYHESGIGFVSVGAGQRFSCAALEVGQILCWGGAADPTGRELLSRGRVWPRMACAASGQPAAPLQPGLPNLPCARLDPAGTPAASAGYTVGELGDGTFRSSAAPVIVPVPTPSPAEASAPAPSAQLNASLPTPPAPINKGAALACAAPARLHANPAHALNRACCWHLQAGATWQHWHQPAGAPAPSTRERRMALSAGAACTAAARR